MYPHKKEKSPECDDKKQKHYVSSLKKSSHLLDPHLPKSEPSLSIWNKAKWYEKTNRCKTFEKSNAKDGKSYFEILQKGYKPPVNKQETEEDENLPSSVHLEIRFWQLLQLWRLNKGTLVVHCFKLHETFHLQKQMWWKKGTNLLFYKYYSTSVTYGNKIGKLQLFNFIERILVM